jgi:hypothetical protein
MWKTLVCSEELPILRIVLSSGLYLRDNRLALGMWLCMAPLQATSRGSCVLGRPAYGGPGDLPFSWGLPECHGVSGNCEEATSEWMNLFALEGA